MLVVVVMMMMMTCDKRFTHGYISSSSSLAGPPSLEPYQERQVPWHRGHCRSLRSCLHKDCDCLHHTRSGH